MRKAEIHAHARRLCDFVLKVYPELSRAELGRAMTRSKELLKADYHLDDMVPPEDILLAIDQACSELLGKHRMNPNWFTLTGMLRDNRKPEEPEDGEAK